MSFLRPVLAASVAALAAASGAPASAEPICLGTAATAFVCINRDNVTVSPDGGPAVDDCVNLGGPPGNCSVPVQAEGPSVSTNGPLYSAECNVCDDAGPIVGGVVNDVGVIVENVRESIREMECLPVETRTRTIDPLSLEQLDFAIRDLRCV